MRPLPLTLAGLVAVLLLPLHPLPPPQALRQQHQLPPTP